MAQTTSQRRAEARRVRVNQENSYNRVKERKYVNAQREMKEISRRLSIPRAKKK